YEEHKVFSFVDKTEIQHGKVSANDISKFIQSLPGQNKDIIMEALELQDLEKLSNIDQYLANWYEPNNRALKRLKKSAKDFDFKFINDVLQAVE
ncbi:MAG: hypothetical protein ACNS64_09760, partial [Candidatus Halalkalibacterium sp. M3_1C_030]